MLTHAVKKLPYLLRYVPDQYKAEQICDKTILENGGTLKAVPHYYRNQEMCNKTANNYPHALEFVPEPYKAKKICDKVVSTYPSTIKFFPEWFITLEMCDKVIHKCCLYLILFLIGITRKKYVTEFFLKTFFNSILPW